jgi:cytochrome c-type biogenesis protein CcmH/NrfF
VPRKIGNALAGRPPIHITGAALWLVVTALLLWAIALLVEAAACQVENSQRRRRRFILAWTFRATAFLAFLLSVVMTKH